MMMLMMLNPFSYSDGQDSTHPQKYHCGAAAPRRFRAKRNLRRLQETNKNKRPIAHTLLSFIFTKHIYILVILISTRQQIVQRPDFLTHCVEGTSKAQEARKLSLFIHSITKMLACQQQQRGAFGRRQQQQQQRGRSLSVVQPPRLRSVAVRAGKVIQNSCA
jgi:hypothetical protein